MFFVEAMGSAYCRTPFTKKRKYESYGNYGKGKRREDLPGFGLSGFGETAEAAKEDMMKAYQEIKEMQQEEGKEMPELEFTYKYDMQSFFDYFSFLNVTKVAELAGINPSLMRQYTSGVTNAGQKQYDKIRVAVERISKELSAATF